MLTPPTVPHGRRARREDERDADEYAQMRSVRCPHCDGLVVVEGRDEADGDRTDPLTEPEYDHEDRLERRERSEVGHVPK